MNEVLDLIDDLGSIIEAKIGIKPVNANQTEYRTPKYPNITFTLSTIEENAGSWGVYEDGTRRKPYHVIISFTVASKNYREALETAIKLHHFFDHKNPLLDKKNIVVTRCQSVSSRDNFLTYEFEYRFGFDVKFAVMCALSEDLVPKPEQVEVELKMEEQN